MHDPYLMASACDIAWSMIVHAAQDARDRDLLEVVNSCESETANQLKRIHEDEAGRATDAPGGLVVAREEHYGLHKRLVDRLGARKGEAVYTFVSCLLALTMSRLVAYTFKQPLIFPSLGPTALLFFEQPLAKPSSPRNTLIGHFVAILAGALSLAIFGLLDHPSALQEGVTIARVGAGALSVALTGAVLLLLRSSHPPTGATTLIVSLGLLQTPLEMVMLMIGVVTLTVVGWIINRTLGVPMPIWAVRG